MKQRIILGLSCGVGVSLFPFKNIAFVLGNIELRTDFYIKGKAEQFRLNFPEAVSWADPKGYRNLTQKIDIVISQPKCGNSSVLAYSRGKQMTSHKGEPSLDLALNGIRYLEPKVWLLENLPALLQTYSKEDLQFLFPNYKLIFHHCSVSEFGNSQKTRKRLIIIGVRKYQKRFSSLVRLLSKPFQVNRPKYSRELIDGVPENGHFRPPMDEQIAIYGGRQMTYQEIQDLWSYMPTKKRIVTPEENFSTAPGVYRDLANDFPATIRKSNRCFNYAGLTYTPRERARIQGIPDEFLLCDPLTHPVLGDKTLFNKGCAAVANTPPFEIGVWFREALQIVKFI